MASRLACIYACVGGPRKAPLAALEGNGEASGECELVTRDDEKGLARLILLADTQRHEVAIAFQHTLNFLGVGHVVHHALARLRNMERVGKPLLERGSV
jgi:hypothetical protein